MIVHVSERFGQKGRKSAENDRKNVCTTDSKNSSGNVIIETDTNGEISSIRAVIWLIMQPSAKFVWSNTGKNLTRSYVMKGFENCICMQSCAQNMRKSDK